MLRLLDKARLHDILIEILSPAMSKLNMTEQKYGQWTSPFNGGIGRIFKYTPLKGGQGTFTWGVGFNFLPIISGNRLIFQRTTKSIKPHLFEWPNEYSNSFFGGDLRNGVCSEWGEGEASHSIQRLFDRNQNKIFTWFDTASTMEGALSIVQDQVHFQKAYKFHSPSPDYVLTFLLAKSGFIDKALIQFDKLQHGPLNEETISSLKSKLVEIGA
jgi:hypothetical protein